MIPRTKISARLPYRSSPGNVKRDAKGQVRKASEELKEKTSTSHGLAALALVSFAVAFFGARLFAVLNPKTIVETGGIHFHHFWYGLIMIIVSGWLGISQRPTIYRRIYAIVFGLGAGLMADEVGLLLTFGNYFSEPTFLVFIAAASVGSLGVLLLSSRESLRYDFLELKRYERFLYVGIGVLLLSVIPLAAGQLLVGAASAIVGTIIVAISLLFSKREGP